MQAVARVRLSKGRRLKSNANATGLGGFARVLGVTRPLDRFATVSKLWAYLGMHVDNGAAPRRRRGQQTNWSAQGRVVCHQLTTSNRACRPRPLPRGVRPEEGGVPGAAATRAVGVPVRSDAHEAYR